MVPHNSCHPATHDQVSTRSRTIQTFRENEGRNLQLLKLGPEKGICALELEKQFSSVFLIQWNVSKIANKSLCVCVCVFVCVPVCVCGGGGGGGG